MAAQPQDEIAFARPGGEKCAESGRRPIDLVHLARQTQGDRALEEEVLGLFMHQASATHERLLTADESERRMLAHTLKGSAASVGAFAIADCATAIEAAPSVELLERLAALIDETHDFIAAINR